MSSNNNQLNIPQAREAIDRFKMQAAPRSVLTCRAATTAT